MRFAVASKALVMVLAGTRGAAHAKLAPAPVLAQESAKVEAEKKKKAEAAKKEAEALARAQDRVVAHYKRSKGLIPEDAGAPARKKHAAARIEKLTCMLGTEDRHARIGVELRNGHVESFAYYSKWKPRTCSVAHKRDGPYSKWQDSGRFTTVVSEKGRFLIENRGRSVHFIFHDVDRMFYCGMEGVIRGTLTVTRGKKDCVLAGVMDEESDGSPTLASNPDRVPVPVQSAPSRGCTGKC